MILITSTGELLLYFNVIFFSFHIKKKGENFLQDYFWCCLVLPYFYCRIECSMGLNCDQMEEGEQYSEYLMERNPRAYMSMRDYRNLPWQGQQPMERNPNEYRSMRDYRNQWMSSPYGSAYNHSWGNHTNSSWEPRPPQYSPPEPPYYAPTSQQQPPTLSPIEQAILNLRKQVDNFIEEQRTVTVQANQETDAVESSLNKKLDGFQSEIDKKIGHPAGIHLKAHQSACSSRGRKSRRMVLD